MMIDPLEDQLPPSLFSVGQLNHFLLKYLFSSGWNLWEQLGFLIVSAEQIKHSNILFGTPPILLQVLHHLIRYNSHPEG